MFGGGFGGFGDFGGFGGFGGFGNEEIIINNGMGGNTTIIEENGCKYCITQYSEEKKLLSIMEEWAWVWAWAWAWEELL